MSPHRALIVEDNPDTIDMIVDVLASLEHEYDTACSQEEALKRLKAREYSYVLLDIEIPAQLRKGPARIQNTENLLEKIGETKGKNAPPVIIMNERCAGNLDSTEDMMRLAMSMTRKGAADIIKKPFPKAGRTLDRVIKKVLAGKRGSPDREKVADSMSPPAPPLDHRQGVAHAADATAPDSRVEPSREVAQRPAENGKLTRMQLEILEALAESRHATMVQADIIEASGYGKHAVVGSLKKLRALGMVHRPQGPHGGESITEKGRETIAAMKNSKSGS